MIAGEYFNMKPQGSAIKLRLRLNSQPFEHYTIKTKEIENTVKEYDQSGTVRTLAIE
jgi:hypothetical protein